MADIDLGKIFEEAREKVEKATGRINILIAGKTGVGKSTLINAVFQGNMAETGQGKPVTKDTKEIKKEGIPVSIFDTRGLETKEYKETLGELEKFIDEKRNETDENRQIHVAWICIREDSRRVEDAEIELVNMLSKSLPVIGVITKSRADNGFQAEVKKLLPNTKNVIRVRAVEETLDEGIKLPQLNLDKLVELTAEVIPEGRRNAFIAAQKASLKHKISRAQVIIASVATAAGAAGASPIPFSDAVILIPIELGMLQGIIRNTRFSNAGGNGSNARRKSNCIRIIKIYSIRRDFYLRNDFRRNSSCINDNVRGDLCRNINCSVFRQSGRSADSRRY